LEEWEDKNGIIICDLDAHYLLTPIKTVMSVLKSFVVQEFEKRLSKYLKSKGDYSLFEIVNILQMKTHLDVLKD